MSESTKAGLNSSIGASAGVLKSSIGSSLESSWTQDTKVVSKATIQATFKRLYEGVSDQLALRAVYPADPGPTIDFAKRMLYPAADVVGSAPWIVDPTCLERGALAEIQVELQADTAFRLSAMVGTFADLAAESKELSQQVDQQGLEKVIEINRLLEKLMVGLVPLRCRVVDYVAFTTGGRNVLVHQKVIEALPDRDRPQTRDVFLVGVTEQSLFWKDIRRILFSNSRFRVLCRLNNDGLSASWTPVKLAHVFGEIAPDLQREMELFSTGALQAAVDHAAPQQQATEPAFRAVVRFGELLSEALNIELNAGDREDILHRANEFTYAMSTVSERRRAFDSIVQLISPRSSVELSKNQLSELRVQACQESGLLPGASTVLPESAPTLPRSRSGDLFIDSEIIAIYW